MAVKFAAITAEQVVIITDDGVELISFKFMFDSKAPRELFTGLGKKYGLLKLNKNSKNEKLEKDESETMDHEGVGDWEIAVGSAGKQDFAASFGEAPPDEEGLKRLLSEAPDCVLLMEKTIFGRFEQACKELGIKVESYHFTGTLATA